MLLEHELEFLRQGRAKISEQRAPILHPKIPFVHLVLNDLQRPKHVGRFHARRQFLLRHTQPFSPLRLCALPLPVGDASENHPGERRFPAKTQWIDMHRRVVGKEPVLPEGHINSQFPADADHRRAVRIETPFQHVLWLLNAREQFPEMRLGKDPRPIQIPAMSLRKKGWIHPFTYGFVKQ